MLKYNLEKREKMLLCPNLKLYWKEKNVKNVCGLHHTFQVEQNFTKYFSVPDVILFH